MKVVAFIASSDLGDFGEVSQRFFHLPLTIFLYLLRTQPRHAEFGDE